MKPLFAKDLMSTNLVTVREDLTLEELAETLTDHEVSGAPVEDASGKLIGVVSITDIARIAASGDKTMQGGAASRGDFFVRGWEEEIAPEELSGFSVVESALLVRDIMTPSVYSVPEDTPLSDVAEIMLESHIHRLLVTRGHETVGLISSTDLLGLLAENSRNGGEAG